MISLLKQIKARRLSLNMKQVTLSARIAIARQQYQRLESKGNPRLSTLESIAAGLNAELMLIPKDKRHLVNAVLSGAQVDVIEPDDDPWKGLLEDLE